MVIMCSNYAEKLTGGAKLRYFHNIKLVNNTDPYSLSTASLSTTCLSTIKRPDLYNDLVLGASTYSIGYVGTIQGILLIGRIEAIGLSTLSVA